MESWKLAIVHRPSLCMSLLKVRLLRPSFAGTVAYFISPIMWKKNVPSDPVLSGTCKPESSSKMSDSLRGPRFRLQEGFHPGVQADVEQTLLQTLCLGLLLVSPVKADKSRLAVGEGRWQE